MAENENTSSNNKLDLNNLNFKDIWKFIRAKVTGDTGEMLQGQMGKYEVNLVPQVKIGMIKMQKTRNLVIFICIVILAVCGGVLVVTSSIKGGQEIRLAKQDEHIKNLSGKVVKYSELSEFLTIQNQLNKITEVEQNKKVLSRVFSIIASVLPKGKDTVTLSELSINLEDSTLSFDAQANAGEDPDIDYRVLEAFKKAANLMTYDYGRYVDADGNAIPSRCIVETNSKGEALSENGQTYAIWTRGRTGCDPSRDDYVIDDEDGSISTLGFTFSTTSSQLDNTRFTGTDEGIGSLKVEAMKDDEDDDEEEDDDEKDNDSKKDDKDDKKEPKQEVVDVVPDEKIWRTPQFATWYNDGKKKPQDRIVNTDEDGVDDPDEKNPRPTESADKKKVYNYLHYEYEPEMDLGGQVSGVPHFESTCIKYYGEENGDKVKWGAEYECQLSPEGITISNSSNGRDSDNNLVLRFSAVLSLDSGVFAFKNKHVMVTTLYGQNVTDSYTQIESMFAAPAVDCSPKDTACRTNIKNEKGE